MALYWPSAKVAVDIIDDPQRVPFEGDADYTVLRVTCAELMNPESFGRITEQLHSLLDNVETTDEEAPYSEDDLSNIEIIATNAEEGKNMREIANLSGKHVRNVSVWEGPVPNGSFEQVAPGMRMSTPEYMFLRKANQLPFAEAVMLGNELCGRFRTSLTRYDKGNTYDYLTTTRTTKGRIRHYLKAVSNTKEGKRARRVLNSVCNEASSPMASYLHTRLCLSRSRGGYGIAHPKMSIVLEGENDLMPAPSGPYLAYDMYWPKKHVALQYVGTKKPSEKHMRALEAERLQVVCLTNEEILNAKLFDRAARTLANLLDVPLPDDNQKWEDARTKLCTQLDCPTFPSMRITMNDLSEHFC